MKIECRLSRIYGPGRTSHRVRITIPRGIEIFNGFLINTIIPSNTITIRKRKRTTAYLFLYILDVVLILFIRSELIYSII